MPIIYRRRSQSFSDPDSDSENVAPVPADADDSIVLSDLVRTGEASRLRRRGAMRLDHGHTGQTIHPQVSSPTVIVVGSPSWDSEPEESQAGPVFSRERLRNIRRPRRPAGDEELSYTYTIFCGAEDEDEDEDEDEEFADQPCTPLEPSLLPLYPPSSSCAPSLSPRKKKSNGCGAVLHTAAAPRQRKSTWLAKDDATGVLVPMDSSYFDKDTASKIVRNPCGCIREGIGCAVCGNPIGIRYRGCKASGDSTTHLRHKPSSSTPITPESPRYWRAPNNHHGSPLYTYTFFANAVSSLPHKFPPRHQARSSVPAEGMAVNPERDNYGNDGLQPTYNNTIFDRIITASPTPLSDLGEDERGTPYRVDPTMRNIPSIPPLSTQGLRWSSAYDPDGEFTLEAEPNSPDKTNEFMLLFPER